MKTSFSSLLERVKSYLSIHPPGTAISLKDALQLLPEKPARQFRKIDPNLPGPIPCPPPIRNRYAISEHLAVTQETADRLYTKLTKRELQVAQVYIVTGNLFVTAQKLCIAYSTAKTHMKHIHSKLQTHDHNQLTRLYLVANRLSCSQEIFLA